jgi:cytochrome c-type biogenesis protein CcmH/NrfG
VRRNGKEAVAHATLACELSKWANQDFVDTLATAYAEAGDFDRAIKYMNDALSKLAPDAEERGELEKHLASFKRREAWREIQ